jgi:hypothetical protein
VCACIVLLFITYSTCDDLITAQRITVPLDSTMRSLLLRTRVARADFLGSTIAFVTAVTSHFSSRSIVVVYPAPWRRITIIQPFPSPRELSPSHGKVAPEKAKLV